MEKAEFLVMGLGLRVLKGAIALLKTLIVAWVRGLLSDWFRGHAVAGS